MDKSLDILKKAISKSKFVDKRKHTDTIQEISVLLADDLSSKSYRKLVHDLRQSLVPIYSAYTLPALRLASNIFHSIYHERILAALSEQSLEEKRRWEDVLNSLLSGILDFLDETVSSKAKHAAAKDAVASALYPTLCDICFSLTAPMQPVDLRCTAYTLLSDTAASHTANQQKLRDKTILGGERLGSMLWRTKDYLALEALLTLFARLLPSVKDSHSNNPKRAAYIRSVFLSPQHSEHASIGQSIAKLLEQEPSNEWEETSLRIVETLATANMAFPQPFSVNEVKACNETKRCDRLYVDDKALLVNVLIGDDQCEALEVPYTTMRKIDVNSKHTDSSVVTIRVATPPVASKVPVKSSPDSPLRIEFTLVGVDSERFHAAIRARGLENLQKGTPPKLSLAKSPARLDFDSKGQLVKELSQSERIENVEKFYHTNQQSSDDLSFELPQSNVPPRVLATDNMPSMSDARPPNILPTSKKTRVSSGSEVHSSPEKILRGKDARPQKKHGTERTPLNANDGIATTRKAEQDAMTVQSVTRKEIPSIGKSAKALLRTQSAQMREKVFGASDEELSEVDDEDEVPPAAPPVPRPKAAIKDNSKTRSTTQTKGAIVEQKRPSSTKAYSGAGRRVLDSDDEAAKRGSGITVSTGARSTANKKKRAIPVTPDISDEDILEPPQRSLVTPPRSQVNSAVAPVTPTKPPAGKAPTLQEPSSPAGEPVIAMSPDLPENDEGTPGRPLDPSAKRAAESAVAAPSVDAPRTVARRVTRQSRGAISPDAAVHDFLTERSPDAKKHTEGASGLRTKPKPAAKVKPVPIDLQLSDHVMISSSPVPVVKPGHTSVKAKLRKKDQTLALDKAAAHVKTSKRKRGAMDNLGPDDESVEPPLKKLRADDPAPKPLRPRRTDSRNLRPSGPAAARATQRYRAKKEKATPPVVEANAVDYDELPNSTTSDARIPSSPTTSRFTRRAKKEDEKRKTEPPARTTRRTAEAAKEKKTEKTRDDPPLLHESTPLVEDDGPSTVDVHAVDEIEDEEEVTSLLTNPSKPSVTVVQTPVVKALKESAASTASKMNPFVEPTITSTSKAKSHQSVSKHMEVKPTSRKKSNKMPWLAATTPAQQDNVEGSPGVDKLDQKDREDRMPEPHLTTNSGKQAEKKSTRDKAEGGLGGAPHSATESEPQVETIDLTADDSPVKPQRVPPPVSRNESSPSHQLELDNTLVEPPQFASTPFRKPHSTPAAGSTAKSARCVTFAPSVKAGASSPTPLGRAPFATSDTPAKQIQVAKHQDRLRTETMNSIKMTAQAHAGWKQARVMDSPVARTKAPRKDAQMDDIVEVLEELQQAILHRVTQKFEGVRSEVRFGRNTLLSEACEDLLQMRSQSVVHFNRLIDLEAEYAKMGRLLSDGYEQLVREGKDIGSGLGRMVSDHDRGSLIKRMPVELAVLPACLRGE